MRLQFGEIFRKNPRAIFNTNKKIMSDRWTGTDWDAIRTSHPGGRIVRSKKFAFCPEGAPSQHPWGRCQDQQPR